MCHNDLKAENAWKLRKNLQTLVTLTSSTVFSCSVSPSSGVSGFATDASSTFPIPSSRLFPAFFIPFGSFSLVLPERFWNLFAMFSRTSTEVHCEEGIHTSMYLFSFMINKPILPIDCQVLCRCWFWEFGGSSNYKTNFSHSGRGLPYFKDRGPRRSQFFRSFRVRRNEVSSFV